MSKIKIEYYGKNTLNLLYRACITYRTPIGLVFKLATYGRSARTIKVRVKNSFINGTTPYDGPTRVDSLGNLRVA